MPTVAELRGPSALREFCTQCQHPWGDHEMHAKQFAYPTDGWITCPVADCKCHSTWSVDEESRPAMERYRAEYVSKGGVVKIVEQDT
jgi:hypothetical protein